MSDKGWIGVDLDGVLARYDETTGFPEIGPPIPKMVERVLAWLEAGQDVRIFTARIHANEHDEQWLTSARTLLRDQGRIEAATGTNAEVVETWQAIEGNRIRQWCHAYLGRQLPITCEKDFQLVELWDDRCEQVILNTGQTVSELLTGRRAKADPSCHACGAPIKLGEPVALFHRECDPCRLG